LLLEAHISSACLDSTTGSGTSSTSTHIVAPDLPLLRPPAVSASRECSGTREQEVCQFCWDWEVKVPALETSIFLIPAEIVKNKEDRLVVLNRVAKSVVDTQRGKHPSRVFTFRGKPVAGMYNSAWKRSRVQAASDYAREHAEPVTWGFANLRVHDLKHTFGRRLRAAGVPLETRKVLLGHRNGDITSHYSAPEIKELLAAANRVCGMDSRKSPALTILKRKTG